MQSRPSSNKKMQSFEDIYSTIESKTIVPKERCYHIYHLASSCIDLIGDAAEVGVYKGGTAYLIAKALQDKQVHLFDTFSGIPLTDSKKDWHKTGDFSDTSLSKVKNFLKYVDNIKFHPGIFPETAKNLKDNKFSFVFVDCDIYSCVKACCGFFLPRLSVGGVILFDDYKQPTCPGVKIAIEDYLETIDRTKITQRIITGLNMFYIKNLCG